MKTGRKNNFLFENVLCSDCALYDLVLLDNPYKDHQRNPSGLLHKGNITILHFAVVCMPVLRCHRLSPLSINLIYLFIFNSIYL